MTARKPNLATRWLQFAQEDLRIIPVLIKEEAFGMACFHAQQAAEKALKAFVVHHDQSIPKVHHLGELLAAVQAIAPDFKRFETKTLTLDQYYVPTRYPDALPGSRADGQPKLTDAKSALVFVTELLDDIRHHLETK